jgi:hypothetical protein
LVIVPDGDLHGGAEVVQNAKAFRLGDVFQVDASERGLERLDDGHEGFRVSGIEHQRDGIYPAEKLEDERLSLHDGEPRFRADVPQSQDARPVGDDGDGIAAVGQLPDLRRLCLDGAAGVCDPGVYQVEKSSSVRTGTLGAIWIFPRYRRGVAWRCSRLFPGSSSSFLKTTALPDDKGRGVRKRMDSA